MGVRSHPLHSHRVRKSSEEHPCHVLHPQRSPHAEAELLLRRAVEGRAATLGFTHPDTLQSVDNLVTLLQDIGKHCEAEPLCRLALAGRQATLGSGHPDTLTS